MFHRLGWIGLGLLVVGIIAALITRLVLSDTALQFSFWADPAITLLIVALALAAPFLILAALGGWQARRVQRALAEQAQAQETEHRRFIQRLDHELKNPLTAIQVQLDNLQAADGMNAQDLIGVRAQTDRLALLTRGLRRLADLETRSLEIEKIDVGELLDEMVDLLQAPERIQLDVQTVPWPIPPLHGDRELLLMVFRNLVDNALKYSPSSAPVQVRARDMSGQLGVEVIDTGRGILPDELPLVKEELYRGSNTRDVAGSGLGLAIVHRIIERHGGRLNLQSRAGQGTIASLQLPYGP